jgi:NifU-like protein involved in Fe-S cluster formation
MDHFLHPRNVGVVTSPSIKVEIVNEICGDKMSMTIRVDSGKITAARFQSLGCAVAIATASLLTESITGRPVDQVEGIAAQAFQRIDAGVHDEKLHCRNMVRQLWAQALKLMTMKN